MKFEIKFSMEFLIKILVIAFVFHHQTIASVYRDGRQMTASVIASGIVQSRIFNYLDTMDDREERNDLISALLTCGAGSMFSFCSKGQSETTTTEPTTTTTTETTTTGIQF